nr:putative ribonuclease H-like domain-containing protein [Tanacetum cinerariifolium]
DETAFVLKTFIIGLENLLSLKVKIIRYDNGTEFKNADLNQFCGLKGIKREFSVPRTPQQNDIAERKNRTLIEETLHVNFIENKPTVVASGPVCTNDFSAAGPSNAAMPNLEDLSHNADTVGLQEKQKKDGIFISQDKYVAEILRKFGLSKGKSASTLIDEEKPLLKDSDVDVHTYRQVSDELDGRTYFLLRTAGKSASTLIDTEKPLLKDSDGEDVDVHTYRSMIGSLMYLTSSRPDIMFAVCACTKF